MKFPESRLNIGDTLYDISGKDIRQWSVIWVRCTIDRDFQSKIVYGLLKNGTSPGLQNSIYESQVGKDYFTSKKELFVCTFGDCLTEGLVVK